MDTFYEGLHVFLHAEVTMKPCEGIPSQGPGTLLMQRSLLQTTLMSLVPFANASFLWNRQTTIITYANYKKAFMNWKFRGNNRANAPQLLYYVYIS
jgi:hypothetical protein